jgi:alpha-L-fucosidase
LKDVPDQGYAPEDLRFTASKDGKTLYAFCLGAAAKEVRITSLGSGAKLAEKPVASVQLLGSKAKVSWKQEADALVIQVPAGATGADPAGFKVGFRN